MRLQSESVLGDNRDYHYILKHAETTKKHIAFSKQCKLSQQKEAQLSVTVPAEPDIIRMSLDGAQVSSVLTVNWAFRLWVTWMQIAAGIVLLNTSTVIHPALEDMWLQEAAGISQHAHS
jgi:hypothetical protein